MASLTFNSLYLPPSSRESHPARKLSESSYAVTAGGTPKPITIRGNPPTFVSAPGRRIIAVGDLHGDLSQTRSALEIAGVISSDGRDSWIGGDTVVVQLGDILDRGEDEIAILSLFRGLHIQAKFSGGAVFQVNGNHETMNVEGDFRYADPGAFEECIDFIEYLEEHDQNWEEAFVEWVHVSEIWKEDRRASQSHWDSWNLIKIYGNIRAETEGYCC
ncbi:hypothetical protein KSP39_PZI013841 [Platanthera zijinensis]|uniref:Calcineurin-like phosphoesterase domain-containing protein n=1 Tax=Platanthera zijinensis TaxID=2320716 RepID=A0AAP0BC90_9ASPA